MRKLAATMIAHTNAAQALTLILVFALAFVQLAQADDASSDQDDSTQFKELSLAQLGDVQVTTASKEPEEIWKTPAAIYVLTQEDIRRSGATSIPEVLRLVPGVEVARIDSDHWSVGIRGFGSEFSKSVLVLIDGRSVYSPLFSGVYWNVENVMLQDVERIEVIRGPGGTIWGANAVNGVINIITKSAKETHGGLASVSGGNVDQGTGDFRYGGGNGKTFDYRVYGMAFGRAAEFHPASDPSPFDAWQMGQGGFRTDWQLDTRDSLTIQGDMYKGYDGERVSIASYSPPSTTIYDDPHNVAGGNLLGRWRHQIDENSDFQLQTYYDRTSRLSPQLDEVRNTFDVDFLYHRNLGGRQDILLGAGGRWSPDNITQKFPTLDFVPQEETDSIYSWFAQDQISILPQRLFLTLGSKFEHNNYSGFEVQPNGRLLWSITDHQSLWVAVTRAVRTPSRLDQDLQLTDFLSASPPLFLRVVGSKTFKSEQMLGTEVGYRTLVARKLYIDTTFFHNSYNDLYGYGPATTFVESAPTPAHIVLQLPLANANMAETNGVEIAPDWQPFRWWQLKGSYSFLHLQANERPSVAGLYDVLTTAADNGSSPHHEIEMQSLFNLPKHFEFDTTYRFVSALPAQASTPAGQTVGAYSTGDVRLGWNLVPNLEISFVGQNLFQPEHPEFGGDDGPLVGIRRSYYARVTWTSPEK
jgi:iron complex outermembrane recepter protein